MTTTSGSTRNKPKQGLRSLSIETGLSVLMRQPTSGVKSMTDTNKSTRVGGHSCRSFVQKLLPFHNSGTNHRHSKGSTLWGEWLSFSDGTPSLYVVYSYGNHWPLYVNWRGVWFSNKDKFGPTTSKHSSQAHPLCPTVPLSKVDLEYLVLFGQPHDNDLVAAAKLRLLPDDLIPMAVAARIGGE